MRLIDVASRSPRHIEARLAGFRYSPLAVPVRRESGPEVADLKISGAAADVLEGASDPHAIGVAELLIGQRVEAVAALERAARDSTVAQNWNDLAAARFTIAVDDDRPSLLPRALADADHALRLAPRNPEALFNRALILERLGIREQARDAWLAAADVDRGGWGNEAREHARKLEARPLRFDGQLLRSARAEDLVRDFPKDARRWSEGVLLADWAEAVNHDPARAEAILERTRAIAGALAASHHELLLADAVRAAEASTGASRRALIEAYELNRRGREASVRHAAAQAEHDLRCAAERFATAKSPMADVATYYAATAAFEQNHDVDDELSRLLARVDVSRHRALGAEIRWTLALNANRAGDWGGGVRNATAASATFYELGERTSAATCDSIAAYALEVIGDLDGAWRRRIRASEVFCDGSARVTCDQILDAGAQSLTAIDRSEEAVAIARAASDGRASDPANTAMTLAKRARVLVRGGDLAEAARTLAEARREASRIADPAIRDLVATHVSVDEAAARIEHDPAGAIAALDAAVTFFTSKHVAYALPDVYLQRARAWRAAGHADAAARDYAAAIGNVESQRRSIDDPSLRFAFLDTVGEAIEESVDLELSRGAGDRAFAISDRRHLLDSSAVMQQPPATTAIIEYAVLKRSLVIFCVAHGRVTADRVAIGQRDLANRVGNFVAAVRRRASVDGDAADLFDLLMRPLQPRLGGIRQLAIVPDRDLYALPFAALRDGGRFLIEDYAISIAPAAAAAPAPAAALEPALVVADPASNGTASTLRFAREEASAIGQLYGATSLSGAEATPDAFAKAASRSALIHYAGHADSGAESSYGALALAGGVAGSNEIARLSLPLHPFVVLAACGTFRGETFHAAGMSSLARAFLLAGARGVAGTLWEIDDDTSLPLFLRFHQSLRAGASPAAALRDAQLASIHAPDARTAHPATWAPVEITQPVF